MFSRTISLVLKSENHDSAQNFVVTFSVAGHIYSS